MKTCPKEEILQALLDGELKHTVAEAMRTHLSSCANCATAMQEMERSWALINSAFAVDLPEAVPTARLAARIESALADEATPKWAWQQLFWRFGWMAAAMLVMGIAGWLMLRSQPKTLPQQVRIEATFPGSTPKPQPVQAMAKIAEKDSPKAIQPTRRRVKHYTNKIKPEEIEAVTPFYSLREGEDLAPSENLRMVRVELPSSALGEVGLPIALAAANMSVKADVMLGDDGLARAIRFVR